MVFDARSAGGSRSRRDATRPAAGRRPRATASDSPADPDPESIEEAPVTLRLDGKVALVTGAGSPDGIGYATSRRLRDLGARVAIVSTTRRIHDRAAELGVTGFVADLTDEAEVGALADAITDQLGDVEVLVNNAGLASRASPEVLRPVAQTYVNVVPQLVRTGVSNVFGNISDMLSAVNNALQGKREALGNDLGRVLVNTTFGLGGIFDVAGYPKVLAKDLVKALAEQAAQFKQPTHLGQRVTGLHEHDGHFVLETDQDRFPTRAIIIAAGIGAFSPRRLPHASAEPWYGRGIYDVVTDPEQFRDRRVLIIGGGDTAFDWGTQLLSRASRVTLVHRSDRFRAHGGGLLPRRSIHVMARYGRHGSSPGATAASMT